MATVADAPEASPGMLDSHSHRCHREDLSVEPRHMDLHAAEDHNEDPGQRLKRGAVPRRGAASRSASNKSNHHMRSRKGRTESYHSSERDLEDVHGDRCKKSVDKRRDSYETRRSERSRHRSRSSQGVSSDRRRHGRRRDRSPSRTDSEPHRNRRGGGGGERRPADDESRLCLSPTADKASRYNDEGRSERDETSVRRKRHHSPVDSQRRSRSRGSSRRRDASHQRKRSSRHVSRSSSSRRRSGSPGRSNPSSRKASVEKRESHDRSSKAKSETTEGSTVKKTRRTGWDSGPSLVPPVPTMLPSLGGMNTMSTGFTASLAGKTPQQIQEELAERQAQAASIAATMQMKASASQLCRIYVGSLDYSLTENDIRQVFSAFGPITNVDMPKEGTRSKGFCFVEYANPESANMAITTMPGFNLKGRAIKVGRPTALGGQSHNALTSMSLLMGGATPMMGLTPKAAGVNAAEAGQLAAAMLLAKADGSGTSSQNESLNRVYVGNVPFSFTSDDIKQIFDVFGRIISCQLIPNSERPGTHRGYGFIEYSTVEEARLAIETMNDFPVAGKVLKVNYATAVRGGFGSTSAPPPSLALHPGASGPSPIAATGANAVPVMTVPPYVLSSQGPAAAVPPQPSAIPHPVSSEVKAAEPAVQSALVVLSNMVERHEANDELKEEIQQECSKYGGLPQVDIKINDADASVRIFLQFEKPEHAALAVPSLHDRWFGGRKINAKLYSPSDFAAGRYWL